MDNLFGGGTPQTPTAQPTDADPVATERPIGEEKPPTEVTSVGMLDLNPDIPGLKTEDDRKKWSQRARAMLRQIDQDRSEWLARKTDFLCNWNEYVYPIRTGAWDESSTLHLPLTMEKGKALHALLISALCGMTPWFVMKPRERLDKVLTDLKDQFMQWAVRSYVNRYKGLFQTLDDWVWSIVFDGWSILEADWERPQRKAKLVRHKVDEETKMEVPYECEEMVTVFDGPVVRLLRQEDCYMQGDYQNAPQDAPFFAVRQWLTDEEIKLHAAQNLFIQEAAERVLKKKGRTDRESTLPQSTDPQRAQDEQEGVQTVQSSANAKAHECFKCYWTVDIDEDGLAEEIVLLIEAETGEILRATYLDRVSPTGRRPFFKGDLIKRPGRAYSIGIAELMFPLNAELDAIHNQKIDFGTISNLPFFFYQAMAGIKQEELRLSPGVGIPVDDVSGVKFPQMPNSTAFGFQEEQNLTLFADKITISGPAVGQPTNPMGAGRTATGMTTVLSQTNIQLDIFVKRIQEPFSELLNYLDALFQTRLPDGVDFRVLGSDGLESVDPKTGRSLIRTVRSRFELAGKVDYELCGNSASSNRELEFQKSLARLQTLQNPLYIQLGIQTPNTIYENIRDFLRAQGVVDPDRLIARPQSAEQPLSLTEEVSSCLAGVPPKVVLNDDHEAKLKALDMFRKSEQYAQGQVLGTISPRADEAFLGTMQKHQELAQAVQAQAEQSNVSGLQLNPKLSARVAGTQNQNTGEPASLVPPGTPPPGSETPDGTGEGEA